MPRFVLLRHECPPDIGKPSHWDFMLEDDGALLTWSFTVLPQLGGPSIEAERLGIHRIDYLDHEGPVSGNRGEVRRTDAGEFEWLLRQPDCWRVELCGATLRGTLTIRPPDEGRCQMTLADRVA